MKESLKSIQSEKRKEKCLERESQEHPAIKEEGKVSWKRVSRASSQQRERKSALRESLKDIQSAKRKEKCLERESQGHPAIKKEENMS
ncbi:hypothetical protein ACOJQI_06405 [Bacillus salacetis]|uniref:hypothetical protein n=1 Tax=Bacillus salacetis TaxID=2315464 RepID=UPI003BA00D81